MAHGNREARGQRVSHCFGGSGEGGDNVRALALASGEGRDQIDMGKMKLSAYIEVDATNTPQKGWRCVWCCCGNVVCRMIAVLCCVYLFVNRRPAVLCKVCVRVKGRVHMHMMHCSLYGGTVLLGVVLRYYSG